MLYSLLRKICRIQARYFVEMYSLGMQEVALASDSLSIIRMKPCAFVILVKINRKATVIINKLSNVTKTYINM